MALDDGAQIDPATLPENLALIASINTQLHAPNARAPTPAFGDMSELVANAIGKTLNGLAQILAERGAPHPLEEDLRGGLAAALNQSAAAVFTEARLRLPGWQGNLGGFDVAAVGSDGSIVLIETKWGSVWQSMWDVLKLASAQQHHRVVATYAVYAATRREWTRDTEINLFGDWDTRQFEVESFLDDNESDWESNLSGSPTVHPIEIPSGVGLEAMQRQTVDLIGRSYDVRTISVRALPGPPLRLERGGRLPNRSPLG